MHLPTDFLRLVWDKHRTRTELHELSLLALAEIFKRLEADADVKEARRKLRGYTEGAQRGWARPGKNGEAGK